MSRELKQVFIFALVFTFVIFKANANVVRGSYAGSGPIYHGRGPLNDQQAAVIQNRFSETIEPIRFQYNNLPPYPLGYQQQNLYQVPYYRNPVYPTNQYFG